MNKLEKMCRDHFNEPMLVAFEVRRCIGYAEDEDDCYVITLGRGGKVSWVTCVGGYTFLTPLKDQNFVVGMNGDHYDDLSRLDSMLAVNDAPQQESFALMICVSSTQRIG